MAHEAFIEWNPTGASRDRVDQCESIIEEYAAQGFRLTLRQLYYQFVSRALIKNTERNYKNLGALLAKARMAGLIDWDAIEDRGRRPQSPNEWTGLREFAEDLAPVYRLPRWHGQGVYVELWVEKEALAGILAPLASEYHVTLMVNKGYSSVSAMYESAKRLLEAHTGGEEEGVYRPVQILYLGDHDPSGQDMVRDVLDRLQLLTRIGYDLEVKLIALTTAQVEQHEPPPNPTKLKDSRAKAYIREHGYECWEVDALDPATLQALIAEEFAGLIDRPLMDEIVAQEKSHRMAFLNAVDGATDDDGAPL